MATFKCKMCGGQLEVQEGQSVCTCEFCGTAQTVPHFDNEKKATFFKRAHELRFKCEFDKAAGVYETIVTEYPGEAEAYWGLVLCKYGIEYVDDPKTGKKIPTCHRTQFSSIFEDHDYLAAIRCADAVARELYKREANAISKLQSAILEISSKEDPFDVFICYKETDERGGRTADSVLAQDVYDELTSAGYKVFFARRTLERKLGSEYEPYIFAALHSAKVMVHVSTSKANSESVWVKNEWARYLSLIAEGQKKTLIPCYKGISAYELPEEMKNLQGQDMSKLGAMQDLIYGIKKILKPTGRAIVQKNDDEPAVVSDTGFDALVRKGYTYLKNHKMEQAKRCFEKAIEATELCGDAYLGLLLCEYQLDSLEELLTQTDLSILESENFKLAREFANKSCNETLKKVENAIIYNEKNRRYLDAKSALESGRYDAAIEKFKELGDFEKAEELIKECIYQKGQMYFSYINSIKNLGYCDDAIGCFEEIINYKDSKEMISKIVALKDRIIDEYKASCIKKLEIIYPKEINFDSLNSVANRIKENRNIVKTFVPSYEEFKNAQMNIESGGIKFFADKCPAFIQSFETLDDCYKLDRLCRSIESNKNLDSVHALISEREKELKDILKALKKKRTKKTLTITGIISAVLAVGVASFFGIKAIVEETNRSNTYSSANAAMESGNYDDAIAYYESLGDYKGSENKIKVCQGLKQIDQAITNNSEAEAVQGIKTIVSAGEKVDLEYETENNVNIKRLRGGNSGNKKETIDSVDFTLYVPTWDGYTFLNWNPTALSYHNERANLNFLSCWSLNTYNISYVLNGGTNDSRNPSQYSVESPDIELYPATKYGYTFKGWTNSSNETVEIINHGSFGDINLSANWQINEYTVKFVNFDGSLLYETKVEHGSTVIYGGQTPTRQKDAQYTYTFSGWDGSLNNVVSDLILTAQYSTVINSYTVTFKNYDGTLLGTSKVNYGSSASYSGNTPTKPNSQDDLLAYEFYGWDVDLSYITGDTTAIAQFSVVNRYLATFKSYDGTELYSARFNANSTPVYTGDDPIKPADDEFNYDFKGWNPELGPITKDTIYTAQFNSHKNFYTANYYNYDGVTLLQSTSVAYGSYSSYTGATPTKPKTQQYTYTFSGWDKDPATTPIVDNTVFIAQFDSTTNEYTVTFKNYDGKTLGTDTVAYGGTAVYEGGTPTKKSDYTGYVFANAWTTTNGGDVIDNLTNVTDNRTVYAKYNPVTYSKIALSQFNNYNAAVITEDGHLYLYGTATNGEAADAPVVSDGASYLPTKGHEVVINGETFVDASIGDHYSLAVTESGKVYAWGSAQYYTLGDGKNQYSAGGNATTTCRSTPDTIVGVDNIKFVKVVAHTTCGFALTEDGDIYSWGSGSDLKLHNNLLPTKMTITSGGNALKFVDITRTQYCMAGLTTSGDIYAWGNNGNCEFGTKYGQGSSSTMTSPTLVSEGIKFKQICGTYSVFGAVSTSGVLYMSGQDTEGMFLNMASGFMNFSPVTGAGTNNEGIGVEKISLGRKHALMVTTSGSVYSWGSNQYGALGEGKTQNEDARSSTLTALDLSGLDGTVSLGNNPTISCGTFTNWLVTDSGKILTWGYGYNYLLGDDNYYQSNIVTKPQLIQYRRPYTAEPAFLDVSNEDEYYSYCEEHGLDGHAYNKPLVYKCTYTIATFYDMDAEDKMMGRGLILRDSGGKYIYTCCIKFDTSMFVWDTENAYYIDNEIERYPTEDTGYQAYATSQNLKVGSSITLYVYLSNSTFNNFSHQYSGHFAWCCVA